MCDRACAAVLCPHPPPQLHSLALRCSQTAPRFRCCRGCGASKSEAPSKDSPPESRQAAPNSVVYSPAAAESVSAAAPSASEATSSTNEQDKGMQRGSSSSSLYDRTQKSMDERLLDGSLGRLRRAGVSAEATRAAAKGQRTHSLDSRIKHTGG